MISSDSGSRVVPVHSNASGSSSSPPSSLPNVAEAFLHQLTDTLLPAYGVKPVKSIHVWSAAAIVPSHQFCINISRLILTTHVQCEPRARSATSTSQFG